MFQKKTILLIIVLLLIIFSSGCNIFTNVEIVHENITLFKEKSSSNIGSFALTINIKNFKDNQGIKIRIKVLNKKIADALGRSDFIFDEMSLPYKRTYHFSKAFDLEYSLEKRDFINSIEVIVEDSKGRIQQSKIVENISEEKN